MLYVSFREGKRPTFVFCESFSAPQADLSYPAPKGVLRVLVKSGCNLRAADLNLSGASSDPYVVIEAAWMHCIPPQKKGDTRDGG